MSVLGVFVVRSDIHEHILCALSEYNQNFVTG